MFYLRLNKVKILNNRGMKTLLFVSLLLVSSLIYGQTFDFYAQRMLTTENGEDYILNNSNFTFIVKNINTFKYDVFVNGKPINHNIEIPDFFSIITKQTNDTDNLLKKINDFNTLPDELKIDSFIKLVSIYNILKNSELFYNSLLKLVGSDSSPQDILKYKKDYYQYFLKKDTQPETDLLGSTEIIKYYSDKISFINTQAPIIKSIYQTSSSIREAIDTIIANTKKIDSSKTYQKLALLYLEISDEKFTVNSFVPKPNADELVITITAKPKALFSKDNKEIKIEIPFMIKGGVKIDFSTGIFISNIVDKEYVNKPKYENDSIIGYNLIQSTNTLSYGLAGYMHVYWRVARNINGCLTLGVGIDQNTQVKIMPGIGLLLGRKERFIISGGTIIGKSKDLSPIQDKNILYKEKTEPIYSEPYKIGWYAGISYNLYK